LWGNANAPTPQAQPTRDGSYFEIQQVWCNRAASTAEAFATISSSGGLGMRHPVAIADTHAPAAPMAPVSSSRTPRRNRETRPTAEERTVASLIALMEAGTTPWRREWDSCGGGHQVNLFSGYRYRGANPVLLSLSMHSRSSALPFWCGFMEAKAHGLFPRKGSKAAHIMRPLVVRADASEASEEEQVSVLFRPVAVFNASDLIGEDLGSLIAERKAAEAAQLRPEPERLEAAEAVLRAWPVPVIHGGERACYVPAIDRIALPDRRAFHSPAALYATWAHEAIHSTGHPSRLNRDLSGQTGSSAASGRAYAREELVAELGAVLLGDRLEIGSDGVNHAAYLSEWIALLKESPRVLFQVLAEARGAADLICPEPVQG
jgi:antirestriction protein ArdC